MLNRVPGVCMCIMHMHLNFDISHNFIITVLKINLVANLAVDFVQLTPISQIQILPFSPDDTIQLSCLVYWTSVCMCRIHTHTSDIYTHMRIIDTMGVCRLQLVCALQHHTWLGLTHVQFLDDVEDVCGPVKFKYIM